jgi:GH35 family endo-1,4-beta-xylanase
VKPEYKEELWKLFQAHIELYVKEYGGRLESWDVVNESVNVAPGKERHPNMPDDYTFRSWEIAQNGFPKEVKLCINDSWRAVYPPFIKSLIDRGAKIDVVGLQMHIFGSEPMEKIARGEDCITNGTSWKPRDVEAYLRELDLLGRPIHLSEITIPAPGNDARALAIQARVTRDMYRLWFSWPSIYRITWWNVVDNCGFRGEPTVSGLFTRQMEPKPVYCAMDQLINHDWKTTLTLKADEAGKIVFRGFKGEYELSWTGSDGKTYSKRVQVQ